MSMVRDYPSTPEFQGLGSEVRRIWDGNAEFWDSRMGHGNRWHRLKA